MQTSKCFVLVVVTVAGAFGQSTSFEVASIKMCPPGAVVPPGTGGFKMSPDGSIRSSYTTMRMYLQWAYDVAGEISGPRWIDEERYDISAKAAEPAAALQLKLMFQTLLADRFKLKVHIETKELPATALVVGKSGTRNLAPAGTGGKFELQRDNGMLVVRNGSMASLANILGSPLGDMPVERVLDQTGLSGLYNIKLDLKSFDLKDPAFGGNYQEMRSGLSSFVSDALERQYGLRLERRKVSFDSLVVDRGNRDGELAPPDSYAGFYSLHNLSLAHYQHAVH